MKKGSKNKGTQDDALKDLGFLSKDSVPTPKEKKEFEDGFDDAIVAGIERQIKEERKIAPETGQQTELRKARLDALELQLREAKQKTEKRAIIRKTVAFAIAKWVRESYGENITLREAATKINEVLKSRELETYSEKHLIRIINELGFKPGKAGRKPKK